MASYEFVYSKISTNSLTPTLLYTSLAISTTNLVFH